ncbi:MAG: nickel pincer cofactor biosynthesis protein LarC [Chloroflexota bacterium]|nr:nickel pincer cofactor biosynthesis protein LarC [Chloroflexota bacterium]
MRIAYFDCFSGISGDMMLGALVDAGWAVEDLRRELDGLGISGYEIEARKVKKHGITGTKIDVHVTEDGVERKLRDIVAIIDGSDMAEEIKESGKRIFTRLATVEARIHQASLETIHFHEVGGLDAIVDVVGSLLGLRSLGVQKVYASPLPLGKGFIRCAHGTIPVPAPATLELVKGIPVHGRDIEAELVTPTGAAIITTLSQSFGPPPLMIVENIGYGAGYRDLAIPNLLRVSVGAMGIVGQEEYEEDVVTVVETNIDDMNPQFYDYVMSRLFERGAVDVFCTPIQMKRNRPAITLSAITDERNLNGILEVIFDETTTLGVRIHEMRRKKLTRENIPVNTRYGEFSVKVGKSGNVVKNIAPEYEECRRVAEQGHIPLKEVYEEASGVAREILRG